MKDPIYVLHAPTTVGGNPNRLSQAENELGLISYTVSTERNYLNYHVDKLIDHKNKILKIFHSWYWAFIKVWQFDVIHYNFGRTLSPARESESNGGIFKELMFKCYYNLFGHLDLKILSLSNKAIFVTFQGDDARQGDYCRSHYRTHFAHEVGEEYYSNKSDQWKRKKIEDFRIYADVIYSVNPDLLHVLPAKSKFLPYAGVNLTTWKPHWPQEGDDFIPHVIHAPSHRVVKGSSYIEDAVRRLHSEGIQFKFTLVEGISNSEARKIYETADLLIDQLLAGYYGGLSVELMSLGKPVICYMRPEDMVFLPEKMRDEMPIINANPNDIYSILKEWITIRKKDLHQKGKESRKYVENWHDPIKIASIVKKDYEDVLRKKMAW